MKKFFKYFSLKGDSIEIEVSKEVSSSTHSIAENERSESIDKMLAQLNPFYEALAEHFNRLGDHQPDSATAEFGIRISAEGKAFIIQGGDATIKFKVSWEKKRNC
jgi:hypothetical protein